MSLINIPVVYFIYNRPDLTLKSFSVIKKLKPKILFIISDGPKTDSDLIEIKKVRNIVSIVNWKCKIYRKYSKTNLGNSVSTSEGLDYVFSIYDKLIFMEDDSLPHIDFFKFCEINLKKYENNKEIYAIGGRNPFNYALSKSKNSYIFSVYPGLSCFAFWKRSWKFYNKNLSKFWLSNIFSYNFFKKFSSFLSYIHFSNTFNYFYLKTKKMDAWDFPFFCNILCKLKNPLCIFPEKNLYINIGINHTRSTTPVQRYTADFLNKNVLNSMKKVVHPKKVLEDKIFGEKFFRAIFFNNENNIFIYCKNVFLLLLRFAYSTTRVFGVYFFIKILRKFFNYKSQ